MKKITYDILIADLKTGKRSCHMIVTDTPLYLVIDALCKDTHRVISVVTIED